MYDGEAALILEILKKALEWGGTDACGNEKDCTKKNNKM